MKTSNVPDLLVEQLALGELSESAATEVRGRLGEAQQRERLAALEADDQLFRADHPADTVVPGILRGIAEARRRRTRLRRRTALAVGGPTVALISAAAVWLLLAQAGAPADELVPHPLAPADTVRLKGASELNVQRVDDGQASPLVDGAAVSAGDVLQLAYRSGGAAHGVIVSIDGSGTATLHFPTTETGSNALLDGQTVRLGFAYQLDTAPNFERFFFVTSSDDLDTHQVMAAARRLAVGDAQHARLDLRTPNTQQHSLLLLKE